jgi:pimeloyl-ACP methyl ester carboxylesterase
MADAVRAGYASSSTDTGHESTDTAWLYDRQRIIDYGYRAIHEMTVKAKAVIEAHYGRAPEYSYFNGCSTGGRQGLMAAQRYPDDYDGIVSGAPVNRFTHLHRSSSSATAILALDPSTSLALSALRTTQTGFSPRPSSSFTTSRPEFPVAPTTAYMTILHWSGRRSLRYSPHTRAARC